MKAVVSSVLATCLIALLTPTIDAQHVWAYLGTSCALTESKTIVCDDTHDKGTVPSSSLTFSQLTGGRLFTCGLQTNGQITCFQQFATANPDPSSVLAPPAGAFVTIAGGYHHLCALKAEGSAVCWGRNVENQVSPVPNVKFRTVVVGYSFSCGLLSAPANTIRCWGSALIPSSPLPARPWIAISAGCYDLCALGADGTAQCVHNVFAVPPNEIFAQISSGFLHSCGLLARTRRIICWGYDALGEVQFLAAEGQQFLSVHALETNTCAVRVDRTLVCEGVLTMEESSHVPPLRDVGQISAHGYQSCALRRSDGYAVCFGSGLGNRYVAPAVQYSTISTGYSHVCGLVSGALRCFGLNSMFGEATDRPGPYIGVACGAQFTCVLKPTGDAECFGENADGRVTPPTNVRFIKLSSSLFHTCGIVQSSAVLACWGSNQAGQSTPVPGQFRDICAGAWHSCGIKTDGNIACFGVNADGQAPPSLQGPFDDVACGFQHTCAITAGVVSCFGSNAYGQREFPPAPAGWVEVACGDRHTCARHSSGMIKCVGSNVRRQSTIPGLTVGELAPVGRYATGLTTAACLPGSYSLSSGSWSPLCSGPCPPGRYGLTTGPSRQGDKCEASCPKGSYCLSGSARPTLCPAGWNDDCSRSCYRLRPLGRFGARMEEHSMDCSGTCVQGFWCPSGSNNATAAKCPPGRYGAVNELKTSSCNGECDEGYECPSASSSPQQLPCDNPAYYCPKGAPKPRQVDAGFRSVSRSVTMLRFYTQATCDKGAYCANGLLLFRELSSSLRLIAGVQSLCPKGRFSDQFQQTTCQPCGTGKFGDREGLQTSQCSGVCDAGYICPEASTTNRALVCGAPSVYCKAGALAASEAPPGFETKCSTPSTCYDVQPCKIGHFCLAGKAAPCPAGSYADRSQQSACSSCPVAHFASNGGSACTECAKGRYSGDQGRSACLLCPLGRFANETKQSACRLCQRGRFGSAEGLLSAQCSGLCLPGFICPTGSSRGDPIECGSPAVFCPAGSFQAQVVRVGHESIGGTKSSRRDQQPCRVGYQCIAGEATLCPRGRFSNRTGLSSCFACPKGRFGDRLGMQTAECSGLCDAGFLCPEASTSKQALPCGPSSVYCKAGALAPTEALPGTETICPTSTTCSETQPCRLGHACQTGRARPCPAGFVADIRGLAECRMCNIGRFSLNGSSACTDCPEGRYSGDQGRSSCLPCPLGRFANQTKASVCRLCERGKFGDVQGLQSAQCSGMCRRGFICPAGAIRDDPIECGSPAVFCPAGALKSQVTKLGCETIGDSQTTGYDQQPCKLGSQCVAGESTLCPRGRFSNRTGLSSCFTCPKGRFGDGEGLHTPDCSGLCDAGFLCPEGSISKQALPCGPSSVYCERGALAPKEAKPGDETICLSASSCIAAQLCRVGHSCQAGGARPCSAGLYAGIRGLAECLPCPAGRFSRNGSTTCTTCPAGSFSAEPARSACLECKQGEFQPEAGKSTCLRCAKGSFQDEAGQTGCKRCNDSFYSPEEGRAACLHCNTFVNSNHTGCRENTCEPGTFYLRGICELCPLATFSSARAATICQHCDPGFYTLKRGTVVCASCPRNMHCSEGRAFGNSNFWAFLIANGTEARAAACPSGFCAGGHAVDQDQCGEHREQHSILCARCEPDYVSWNGPCTHCPSANYTLIIGLLASAVVSLLVLRQLCQQNASAATKVLFFFVSSVRLMAPHAQPLKWFAFLDWNLPAATGLCIAPLNAYQRTAVELVCPVLLFGLLFAIFVLHSATERFWPRVCSRPSLSSAIEDKQTLSSSYIRTAICLLLVTYSSISSVVLSSLNCITIDMDNPVHVVWESPELDCNSPEYQRWKIIAIALVVFPIASLPCLICAVLVISQRRGLLNTPSFRSNCSILTETYRASAFWFETAAVSRRTLFTIFSVVLWETSTLRMTVLAMLCFTFFAAQLALRPFRRTQVNVLESLSLFTLSVFGMLEAAMLSSEDHPNWLPVLRTTIVIGTFLVLVGSAGADVARSLCQPKAADFGDSLHTPLLAAVGEADDDADIPMKQLRS